MIFSLSNILTFGVIPVLSVVIIFFIKRKMLWVAPLVSTLLVFVSYMILLSISGMESPITQIFGNNEWRGFFLIAMSMHLGIVITLTVIAYVVAYMLKRKRDK